MRQNRLTISIAIFTLIGLALWCFALFHKSVEPIPRLIGKNYDYAVNYLGSKPSQSSSFNIRNDLDELRGGILVHKSKLKDSIIQEYQWDFKGYKVIIWTGRTLNSSNEVIDALRYKDDVRF